MRRIVLAAALATACASPDPAELGSTAGKVDVTWVNAVGVATAGNSLSKTDPTSGWNAGAVSAETIVGDGYVEFTTAESTTAKMAGLSVGDSTQHHADIDFAFYLKASGVVGIYEGGVQRVGNTGTYAAGDVFRIEAAGGVVIYSQNGTELYTSAVAPGTPLGVDTSLNTPGATLDDVQLVSNELVWQNLVGVAAAGSDLTKTSGTAGWNAGASSADVLDGDGFFEFRVGETDTAKMVGLGNGDTSQHYDDIEYAIWLKANGVVGIYEGGVLRNSNIMTYVAGDLFRVQAAGGVVRYSKNGLAPFYSSAVPPSFPLRADTSLYTPGATIDDARLSALPSLCEGSPTIDDPGDFDLLTVCTTITGTLTLNIAGAVSLPNLERVGALVVTNATSIDLPALETVTGPPAGSIIGLRLARPASLPSLTSIEGKVEIFASLDAPLLASIDGATEIHASTTVPSLGFIRGTLSLFVSFSAPALTEVQGNIRLLKAATSLQLPALVSAYSFDAGVKRCFLSSLDLSSLTFLGGGGGDVRGSFMMASPKALTALVLPALESIEGNFIIRSAQRASVLQTISAPLLASSGGNFTIGNLQSLTSIAFPSLTSVGPTLTIASNPVLPNCYATDVRDQLLAAGWTGEVIIAGNDEDGTCP